VSSSSSFQFLKITCITLQTVFTSNKSLCWWLYDGRGGALQQVTYIVG